MNAPTMHNVVNIESVTQLTMVFVATSSKARIMPD